MTMMLLPRWPAAADRALDLAEALRAEAQSAGPPPAIQGLPARPRAAYDRLVDAVNRLPRPLMVLGSLALLGSALVAPAWFAARMEALADMPEALWWIIGAVLSLHIGGRYQEKSQSFRREVAVGRPTPPAPALPDGSASPGSDAALVTGTLDSGPNAAIEEWRAARS